eukprot:Skav211353  [mRNA]  locus=scaffold677:43953:45368:+ [translate_table: standard]
MALSIVAFLCWTLPLLGSTYFADTARIVPGARNTSLGNTSLGNTGLGNTSLGNTSLARPRHRIPAPRNVTINVTVNKTLRFSVVSAVPVVESNRSYIALITEGISSPRAVLWRPAESQERHWKSLRQHPLFCSGPDRSHVSPVKYFAGNILICAWPPHASYQQFFLFHLEDAEARDLGSFVASRGPDLGQYKIMACVRDLFERPEQDQGSMRVGVFSLLVQWMEWSLMKGVEHFLVYKFNSSDSVEEEILKPYLDAGVASMVYFDSCPDYHRTRHGHAINDCLFRAKGHAQWLMPVIDIDEYLYIPGQGGLAHALEEEVFGNLDQVHSLAFKRTHFEKAALNQLDISSTRFTPLEPGDQGWGNPKVIVRTDSVFQVSTHETVMSDIWKHGIDVDPKTAIIHHYRFPYDDADETENATAELIPDGNETIDESLLIDVVPLTEAIQQRFGLQNSHEVHELLERLAQVSAPSCH